MSTILPDTLISSTLFGKTRRGVLGLLFSHPDQSYYLRQITRAVGLGQGSVQRELIQLISAGILIQRREGNQLYFQANQNSPVYSELKSLITKTAGVGDVLRFALEKLSPHIAVAFLYGSVATGKENSQSDTDLMVIGNITFKELIKTLQPAQTALAREINPTVYSAEEYKTKLKAGHHFLNSLIKSKKIFLIGGPSELGKLGPKRLAS